MKATSLQERSGTILAYAIGTLFITANALLMTRGFFFLPLLALVPVIFYFAFFLPEKLFLAVVFMTPLSVELSRFAGGLPFDISLPTEPLIVIMMTIILLLMVHDGFFEREIIYHPVSLAVIFYLSWLVITTVTSTMPVVSLKFLFVRIWFILVFYFFAVKIFRRHRNINRFLWCYILPLFAVIVYTLYNHAGYGLIEQRAAHWVARPFYNDHTAYGAVLTMFIPVIAALALTAGDKTSAGGKSVLHDLLAGRATKGMSLKSKIIWALFFIFVAALVFSYSRAAWLSLSGAFAVWIIMRLKIGFVPLLWFTLLSALLVFILRNDIVREMEKNTQDSSADFREHIRSMTNITSDASNLERINRWKAAVAMFEKRPLLGWGPGTYMFQYAPFQYSYDRTIISTNFADGGDAHSEYLGPLAETGLPGMLGFIAVAFFILLTGFRLLNGPALRRDRIIAAGVILGLVTYLIHGGLNNFLQSDKAAVPFWGFAAILVAIDLYGKKPDAGQEQ